MHRQQLPSTSDDSIMKEITLQQLPYELIDAIFQWCDTDSLYSLVQCCQTFQEAGLPFLYESVHLRDSGDTERNIERMITLAEAISNPSLASRTKSIWIENVTYPVPEKNENTSTQLTRRCDHLPVDFGSSRSEDIRALASNWRANAAFASVLAQIHNITSPTVSGNLALDFVLDLIITSCPDQRFRFLQQVSYTHSHEYSSAPFLYLPSLKKLALGGTGMYAALCDGLDTPSHGETLEQLVLEDIFLDKDVLEVCEVCPNLRCLVCHVCTYCDEEESGDRRNIPRLLRSFGGRCKKLSTLRLTFTDPDSLLYTPSPFRIRSLRSFTFGIAKFDIDGMQALVLTGNTIHVRDCAHHQQSRDWRHISTDANSS